MSDQKQNKFLDTIHEAIIKEELAIPIYVEHINNVLFWSGLNLEIKNKIIDGLKTLENDSKGHVKLLKKVEKIYLNSRK